MIETAEDLPRLPIGTVLMDSQKRFVIVLAQEEATGDTVFQIPGQDQEYAATTAPFPLVILHKPGV